MTPLAIGGPPSALAAAIDHTLLRADATRVELEQLCQEALSYHFATVCVSSGWTRLVAERVRGSTVGVTTVVGFPLGAMASRAKVYESSTAVEDGATELDMVLALGLLKSGDHRAVQEDVRRVVDAVRPLPVKVILEMALLTTDEKHVAIALAVEGGAAFVKTSTGFGPGGATVDDVALMCQRLAELGVADRVRVKASGSIRTRAVAETLLAAGATRLGTSASVAIVTATPATSEGVNDASTASAASGSVSY